MKNALEERCKKLGVRLTEHRKVILRVLEGSSDHPDVELVYKRASALEPSIGIATVYRTLKLFEELNLLEKHTFKLGRSRYEVSSKEHHDHLIDVKNNKILEFNSDAIEELQKKVAKSLGYKLVDHRLELYCVPLEPD
jgi:Fur family ferric uptake transcriptional regulator